MLGGVAREFWSDVLGVGLLFWGGGRLLRNAPRPPMPFICWLNPSQVFPRAFAARPKAFSRRSTGFAGSFELVCEFRDEPDPGLAAGGGAGCVSSDSIVGGPCLPFGQYLAVL